MVNLQEALTKRFRAQQAAHFYLLAAKSHENKDALLNWTSDLLRKITERSKLVLSNHSDILLINQSENKEYKQEELSEIFNFVIHPALEFERKFVIINHAQLIGTNYSNKMLKILESPPIECCFFLLNTNQGQMLPTITSRAVHISVPLEQNLREEEFDLATLPKNLNDLLEYLKKNPEEELKIFETLVMQSTNKIKLTQNLIAYAKIKQQDQTYHNSAQYRHFKLFRLIEDYYWHIGH